MGRHFAGNPSPRHGPPARPSGGATIGTFRSAGPHDARRPLGTRQIHALAPLLAHFRAPVHLPLRTLPPAPHPGVAASHSHPLQPRPPFDSMKPSSRDYLAIFMAFFAVLLCGYGIGHLVGQRKPPITSESASPVWRDQTLARIQQNLSLTPQQIPIVEAELAITDLAIRHSNDSTLLEHLRHIDRLYDQLIAQLDAPQAERLKLEKRSLQAEIQVRTAALSPNPNLSNK